MTGPQRFLGPSSVSFLSLVPAESEVDARPTGQYWPLSVFWQGWHWRLVRGWGGGGTEVLPEVELSRDRCSCLYMGVSPASK